MSRIGEIVFPTRAQCLGCGSMVGNREGFLCAKCRNELASQMIAGKRCDRCGGVLNEDGTCSVCFDWPDGLTARFAYPYDGPAGGIVRTAKYSGVYRVLEWCAWEIEEKCEMTRSERPDLIVPVPMYWLKKRIRGYNQSEKLAEYLAKHTGYPLDNCLVRTRWTHAQAGLSGEKRRTNLNNAFRCRKVLSGKRVVLVDDIMTTSTTAVKCAEVLFAAGAKSVRILTFGRAEKKTDPKL